MKDLLPVIVQSPLDALNMNLEVLRNENMDKEMYDFLKSKVLECYSIKAKIKGNSFRSLYLKAVQDYDQQTINIIRL